MNNHVNFKIAKLLKEKLFDEKCSHYYVDNFQNFTHDGKLYKTGLTDDSDNENILQFVKRTKQPHLCNAPTIAQVVMWMYEKHGIWVSPTYQNNYFFWRYGSFQTKDFNSPSKAYEAAFEHILTNLL